EVESIARTGSTVVVCPSTTVKEGAGLGERKLPELLARGVNVGLGSDSANSSNYLDPVRMLNAAAVGFKEGRRDARVVPAEPAVGSTAAAGPSPEVIPRSNDDGTDRPCQWHGTSCA